MGVVTSLAGAQLRHRPGRWALLAVGVALALTLPVIAAGTGTVVSADTLRRTVNDLEPGSRGILVTDNRSIYDRGPTVELDAVITKQLGRISANPVRKEVVFRQLTSAGSTFFLAGADHLSTAVSLESGRMPRSCTPTRCEVVLVGDTDVAAMTKAAAKIGVVVVGQARRTDPLVVGGSFDTGRVPLLLGSDPEPAGTAQHPSAVLPDVRLGRPPRCGARPRPRRAGVRAPVDRGAERHRGAEPGDRHRPAGRGARHRQPARRPVESPLRPARRLDRSAAARVRGCGRDRAASRARDSRCGAATAWARSGRPSRG